MSNDESWLTVGKVVAPQGLKGELKVNPSSDFPERFTTPGQRWLQRHQGAPRAIELLHGRQVPGKSIFVVRFAGINSRTAAEALVGESLLVPASERPQLGEGEFHHLDLVGLEARLHADGPAIGSVKDLISGGNDLLSIELLAGREVLVPFVEEIVPEVHLKAGWLLLTPPPGLLEL